MGYHEPDYEDYGPSDELSEKIHQLIEEEARAKITGTFEALEQERKNNERIRKEMSELRAKVRGFDAELNQKLREREIEVKREIFNGFHVGDKVFYPRIERHKETCTTCGGKHKVDASLGDGRLKTIDCPDCDYSGKRTIRTQHLPVEDKLRTIIVEINDRGGKFFKMYLHKEDRERRHDEVIFRTSEECQAYCDQKNLPEESATNEI